ncbi:hypothetical protein GCM10010520_38780 [Rhizobium viscosum]|uniref:Uncharacterized protein n=1 Tax=Rhizobium viscosum TaxID=1673 RepID=A0ABR9IQ69_RHIVS|nr:hypothetical protein [Rhizobium viscosum]MBE1505351.1 hypothetical protein [Rhizobium viscosum]
MSGHVLTCDGGFTSALERSDSPADGFLSAASIHGAEYTIDDGTVPTV